MRLTAPRGRLPTSPPAGDPTDVVIAQASQERDACSGETNNLAAAAFAAGASEEVVPPPAKKTRLLDRAHSDPTVVTKELLRTMQTTADAGALYPTDQSDNKTVELRARWTLRGAKQRVLRGAAAAPGATRTERQPARGLGHAAASH